MTRDQLLKAVSTRELLSERYSGSYAFLSRMITGGVRIEYKYDQDEIRAELALRPHVPNKNERRGLTKLAKKSGVQRKKKAV